MDAEDVLSPDEDKVVSHILDRALEPEPEGVAATECDTVMQGDAAFLLYKLTFEEGLLATEPGLGLYVPSLRVMRRRVDAFGDAIAPLQGVLDYGRQALDDTQNRDKLAGVEDVVTSLLPRFPKLSATPVRRRFNWALFGLQPFVDVHYWDRSTHLPHSLHFLPALYGVRTLDEVFRAQQMARDEREILHAFLDAFGRTRRRQAWAMLLGEDARRDLALRSLIASGDAEQLDTARVIVTNHGLDRARGPISVMPGTPTSTWPDLQSPEETESPEAPGPLEALFHGLQDTEVEAELEKLGPDLAASYRQVLRDAADDRRESFIGPASELREIVTGVLHSLAPDEQVTAQDGFTFENSEHRVTRRQRASFILRARQHRDRTEGTQTSLQQLERVDGLPGILYKRASKGAHRGAAGKVNEVARDRSELITLINYLNALLRDLLLP